MAQVIQSSDLGNDQNSQGQTTNGVVQPGQQTSQTNSNQAGQAPVQSQSGVSSSAPSTQGGQASGSNNTQAAGGSQSTSSGGNQVYNPNKQQGSGYTNIQKVLQANQGNQLGSAVGNNLQNTETQAQQNLQNAQGQFNQQTQANQANTQANQQLVQNVLANPTQYTNQSTNPTNAQTGSQFTNLISGQYQGPTALTNASNLQNQAANIAQQGQALGSSSGRIGLLQQMVGNPNYNTGEANLDALLLGQSNSPALQQAKQQALGLTGQVNNAVTGATAQGQQQTAQSQQFGQALQGQLANNITGQTQALQQQATQAQQTNNQAYQQALSDLQSGNVTQSEAQLLGLTQGESVYNVLNGQGQGSAGASAYLQENPNQANISNIANQQQYAQMQALQQLGGQYLNQPAQQALQNFQNPSQAGTYANQQNLIANPTSFQTALTSAQNNYNSILNPAQNAQQQASQIYGLESGQGITQQQVQQFINANPQYANDPYANLSNPNFASAVGNYTVAQLYPGAVQGTPQQNYAWAQNQLNTTNAQLAAAQNELQNQYGAGENINIQPSSYPTIAQTGQNS